MRERLREFLRRAAGSAPPRPTPREVPRRVPRRLRGRGWSATGTRWSCSTRSAATRSPLSRRRGASGPGRAGCPRRRPTRCCRCSRPARALRLQLDAGLRSHRRRFGWDGGFWLPECAYAPGPRVAARRARGRAGSASTRAPTSRPLRRADAGRDRGRARSPSRSTGRRSQLALVARRLSRPTPPTPSSTASRCAGCGSGRSAAAPTTRTRGRGGGAAPGATSSSPRSPSGCAASRPSAGRRGLLVFAIDTELLGHWWSEGPVWLARGAARGARARASGCSPLPAGAGRARARAAAACARRAGARARTCATWDSPRGRRPRLGGAAARAAPAAGARARACSGRRAQRAARELLALQSSDWAFLDDRGQAGDYPFQRATGHARGDARGHRLRAPAPTRACAALAPDLSLAPLLEP